MCTVKSKYWNQIQYGNSTKGNVGILGGIQLNRTGRIYLISVC